MEIQNGNLVECTHKTPCWNLDGMPDPIGPRFGDVEMVRSRRKTPHTDYVSLERYPGHWFRTDFFRPLPPDTKALTTIVFTTVPELAGA